jgi:hypothetical protein
VIGSCVFASSSNPPAHPPALWCCSKTMLLFVIRDHIEEDTPMINLKVNRSP